MYKSAMLGCGGRARAHASAYRFVKGGKIAAICDMNEEQLNRFGDDFEISSRYTDLDEMLNKEKPDLLHIVTAPVLRGTNQRIRYPLMKQASDHGVPAAIIEKPIAVESEDWKQIAGLAEETKTKFIVNTQLNFHPKNLELKQDVAEGRIGEIKFIDASARSTPVDQAPHVLQLVSSYIDNSRPVRVLGQISGKKKLDSAQPSPMHAAGHVMYENGLHVSIAFGTGVGTMASDNQGVHCHKRVFVVGTKGLAEFNLLLGTYYSGITNQIIDLPFDPPDGLMDSLREKL
jgi:predicted dehydrogenase